MDLGGAGDRDLTLPLICFLLLPLLLILLMARLTTDELEEPLVLLAAAAAADADPPGERICESFSRKSSLKERARRANLPPRGLPTCRSSTSGKQEKKKTLELYFVCLITTFFFHEVKIFLIVFVTFAYGHFHKLCDSKNIFRKHFLQNAWKLW